MATMLDAVINLKDNFSDTLKTVEKNISGFQRTSKNMAKSVWSTGKSIESMGKSLSTKVTAPLIGAGALATNEFIKIEEAVSGMSKTIDGTPKEVQAIKDALDELATTELPIDRVDLFGIAETAGQLGVAKESVVDFTETIAKIGKVSDLSYTEGAASLAKFTNIMGTADKDLEKLGSTIVHLDSNTATSASAIVDMGMRLAAAGKQAKMSESDVLGISAALASLGLESQAGGTAFSKVILSMNDSVMSGNKNLVKFAKVAGMTSSEFKKQFEKDATGATAEFVKGLGKIQKEGGNVSSVIEDLGFKEVRTKDALLRLAGATDVFTDTLDKSRDAWDKNMALQEVFDRMTDNTASKVQIMKNQFSTMAEDIGSIVVPILHEVTGYVERLKDKFDGLSDEQKETIVRVAGFAAALGPMLLILSKVYLGVGKVLFKFSDLAKGNKKYGSILGMLKSPSVMLLGILAGLAVGAFLVYKNWEKIKPVIDTVKEAIGDFIDNNSGLIDFFKDIFTSGMDKAREGLSRIWEVLGPLKDSFIEVFGKIIEVINGLMPVIKPIVTFIVGTFVTVIGASFITFLEIVTTAIEGIIGVIDGLLTFLGGVLDFIIGVFTGDWERAWNGVKDIFSGIVQIIDSVWEGLVGFLTAPVEALIDILDGVFHEKVEGIKKAWNGVKEFLKNPIKGTVNLAKKGAGWVGSKLGIGQNYKGTDNWRGGPSFVHEKGAEIIDLPRGSRVYPHDKSLAMAKEEGRREGKPSNSISIAKLADQIIIREEADIDKFAKAFARELEKTAINTV